MLKGQPKGLFVLALANMGERFGYYTMLAIFVLYMQAKFGFTSDTTSTVFGIFLSMVYFLPLFGGLLADKVLGYGKTIALGIVVMFAGYLCLAIPTGTGMEAKIAMFGSLALIAIGTGCFKGNLQALVGNLYDNPKYSAKRDMAFSIFYMCINIGAFFAPSAADGVTNYFMGKDGFTYNANVPNLSHQLKHNEIKPEAYLNFTRLAKATTHGKTVVLEPVAFAQQNATVIDSLTPTVGGLYGQLLTADQVVEMDKKLDSLVAARYQWATDSAALSLPSLKANVLVGLSPVTDTANLRQELVHLGEQSLAVVKHTPKAGDAPIAFTTKDTTAFRKVERVLTAGISLQLCKVIDREKLAEYGATYNVSLSNSYNYGFGVACISLIFSMLIFLIFRKFYKGADKTEKQKAQEKSPNAVELTPQQVKDRMIALGLVFAVVIFFWMSFHQNGLTMTFFARDYTKTAVDGATRFGFSLFTLLPFAVAFYGLLSLIQSKSGRGKLTGAAVALVGGAAAYWAYMQLPGQVHITPQIFQQFNAYFIVIFTPVAVALFAALNKRSKEPSAPRKIGYGMVIAALAFVLLAFGSLGLPTPDAAEAAGGLEEAGRVSVHWLISTYFILTIAELFLSPMGISFVSRVAPPKYKGLAQGGWLAATAVGNYLVAIIGYLWGGIELWIVWSVLVVCCAISAIFLFSVMKKLERTTKDA